MKIGTRPIRIIKHLISYHLNYSSLLVVLKVLPAHVLYPVTKIICYILGVLEVSVLYYISTTIECKSRKHLPLINAVESLARLGR